MFAKAPEWVDSWLSKLTSTEQQSLADSFIIEEQSPTSIEQYEILDYAVQDGETGIKIVCQSGDEAFIPYGKKFDLINIVRKPAIYLYPPSRQEVIVKVDFQGSLTHINPAFKYDSSWQVIAHPDGQLLVDQSQLRYLFWEGKYPDVNELSYPEGFCVSGSKLGEQLEQYLKDRLLTDAEIQDFVTYWVSELSQYPFVSMRIADQFIEKIAPLAIQPQPDVLIRVFCLFKGLLTPTKLQKPQVRKVPRKGFVVVEWGGMDLTNI